MSTSNHRKKRKFAATKRLVSAKDSRLQTREKEIEARDRERAKSSLVSVSSFVCIYYCVLLCIVCRWRFRLWSSAFVGRRQQRAMVGAAAWRRDAQRTGNFVLRLLFYRCFGCVCRCSWDCLCLLAVRTALVCAEIRPRVNLERDFEILSLCVACVNKHR